MWRIMAKFKSFYDTLNEGGNVRLPTGEEAQKLDLSKLNEVDFEIIKQSLLNSFKEMNVAFSKQTGKPFWKDFNSLTKNAKVFSGSTRTFFTKPFKEFSQFKKMVGDMDLQVPDEKMPELKTFLEKSKGKKFGEWTWKGFTSSGSQFNGLLEAPDAWKEIIKFIQIDFEGTPYENDEPTEFATFGHYSSWSDIKKNVKGLFIKYLIRALTSSIKTGEMVIIGKRGNALKRAPIQSYYGFSVDKGVRLKIEPVLNDKGEIVLTDGLPTFTEIPTKNSTYEKSLDKIYSILFGHTPNPTQKKALFSFVNTLQLMKINLDKKKIDEVHDRFVELLWDKGAQGIERNDPEGDRDIKMSAYNEFLNAFPAYRSKQKTTSKIIEDYYKKYRMT